MGQNAMWTKSHILRWKDCDSACIVQEFQNMPSIISSEGDHANTSIDLNKTWSVGGDAALSLSSCSYP
jgi:hypothetical protein